MGSIFQTVASNQTMPGNRAYIRTLNHHWKKKKKDIDKISETSSFTNYISEDLQKTQGLRLTRLS